MRKAFRTIFTLLMVLFFVLQPILPRDVSARVILPGSFSKTSPTSQATNLSTTVTLRWNPSNAATAYGYCIDTVDDDVCTGGDDGYIRTNDTHSTINLQPDTTYYWQVRAYNKEGFTSSGAWWNFHTESSTTSDHSQASLRYGPDMSISHSQDTKQGFVSPMAESSPPKTFGKTSPTKDETNVSPNTTLTWATAEGAVTYGYCIAETNDTSCTNGDDSNYKRIWGTSVGVRGLKLNTTYQWQVRAYNAAGSTASDNDQIGRFTTAQNIVLPGTFGKVGPVNGTTNVSTTTKLTWGISTRAIGYGYCITEDQTKGCEQFAPTKKTESNELLLKPGTTYYWQVRSYSDWQGTRDGTSNFVEADTQNEWWRFQTVPETPKVRPIVYASKRDGNWEIYAVNADGTEATNLSNNPAEDWSPNWSPDRTSIAFQTNRDGNNEIYRMDANGKNLVNLTNNAALDSYPSWSPDGSKIAFHSNRDGNFEIYVMNADGSQQTRLTNNPAEDITPSWSPDGKYIIFDSKQKTNPGIAKVSLVNVDSLQTILLITNIVAPTMMFQKNPEPYPGTDEPYPGSAPAWSPDGTKIVFLSRRDGNNDDIYVMNADGSEQTRLTTTGDNEGYPAWMDGGTHIVFARHVEGKTRSIFIRNANGNGEVKVTKDTTQNTTPHWSPGVLSPGDFTKATPANNAANLPTSVTLTWNPSDRATSYGYRVYAPIKDVYYAGDKGTFAPVIGNQVLVENLEPDTEYYWQIAAYNEAGMNLADNHTWHVFRTTAASNIPGAFAKVSPTTDQQNTPTNITLDWNDSPNTATYEYCIDKTNNNQCDSESGYQGITDSQVTLNGLEPDTSYYWHVRAKSAVDFATWSDGTSDAWWHFTTHDLAEYVPGYTPGEFGTNEAGAANYKIPIAVPAGTAGIAPELALTYDSRGGNSLVGWGWSLGGLSMISRCPTTIVQHGFVDGVDFDENDQYCLDGQLLVAVKGAYGADQTIYRTENETFSKVMSYGKAGGGPEHFAVWSQAGLKMEYGVPESARVKATGKADVLYWSLNKIEDTKGNYLEIIYQRDATTNETYPERIIYTGNEQQNLKPYNTIEFFYEDRPDRKTQYVAGSSVQSTKRIRSIKTYVDTTLVRSYHLKYEQSKTTNRSRLTQVKECDADGKCFNPTKFEWSPSATTDIWFQAGSWQGDIESQGSVYGDFNGDGLTDITNNSGLYLSTGSGFIGPTVSSTVAQLTNKISGDFNGDGLTDIAGYITTNTSLSGWMDNFWGRKVDLNVCLSTGQNFNCQVISTDATSNAPIIAGDFNGDGLTDISSYISVAGIISVWYIYLSNGTSFDKNTWEGVSVSNPIVGDFNGDGLTDMGGYTGSGNGWYICRSTGSGFDCGGGYWSGVGSSNPQTGDFNGDGLTDMGGYAGTGWYMCVSTGTNFTCSMWSGVGGSYPQIADFNNDGMTDIAGYTGTLTSLSPPDWYMCLSKGTNFTCAVKKNMLGKAVTIPMDINGDGLTDLFYFGNDKKWHVEFAQTTSEMVTSITNGHGVDIDIAYQPLTNKSIYTKGSGATFPDVDFQAPMYVVAAHSSSNGIGGTRTISYTYEGLKINHQGRGFLGFHSITATDAETGINTKTYYSQVHPYKSMALKTEQRLKNGTLIQSVENTWDVLSYNQFSESNPALLALTEQHTDTQTLLAESQYAETTPVPTRTPIAETSPTPVATPVSVQANSVVYLPFIAYKNSGTTPPSTPTATTTATPTPSATPTSTPTPTPPSHTYMQVNLPNAPADSHDENGLIAMPSSSGSLMQLIAPNTIGVTYFPYVRQSVVTKYEIDGSVVYSTTTDTEYDSYGNAVMIAVSHSDGYAQTTLNVYENDPGPDRWVLGRLTKSYVVAEAPGQVWQMRSSAFDYDSASGLLVKEITDPNASAEQTFTRTYTHDGYGNIIRSTTSAANIEDRVLTTEYDSRGRFAVKATNALGHSESRIYDEQLGTMTKLTGPNNLSTVWHYDGFGRVIREERADGTWTTTAIRFCEGGVCPNDTTWFANYYIKTETSGAAPSIEYYDQLDRVIRQESVGFDGRTIYTDAKYDAKGQVERQSNPYFANEAPLWSRSTYDELGRVLQQTLPDNSTIKTDYQGFTIHVTNALDQRATRVTNSQGQMVLSRDAADKEVRSVYDSFGNLITLIDPVGNETHMYYDQRGRKTQMYDPDMGHVEYRYNALGELLWQKDARGQEVTFVYDILGRMVQRTEPEGTSHWIYDTQPHGIGKLAGVSGPGGYQETASYDDLGRPIAATTTISNETYTVRTEYDTYSRVARVIYPTDFATKNIYNELGYLSEVQEDGGSTVYWKATAINARGQIETEALGNGLGTNRTYDPKTGHIQRIQTSRATNSDSVQKLAYTFDVLGNLTSRKDEKRGLEETFQYDKLNRLTHVSGPSPQDITYDSLGNITSRSDVGTYHYDRTNGAGPHAVTSITGKAEQSYTYDASGNRLNSNDGSIEYTSFNVPALIRDGSTTIRFAYGPSHSYYRQDTEIDGSSTSTILYIGGLYEKETTIDKVTTHRHFIRGGNGVVAVVTQKSLAADETLYLHRDHIGSIDTITDATGNIIEQLSYDVWGKRRQANWEPSTGTIKSVVNRGFTGHEQLDAVGLIHMGGRVYDPLIGRFLSADPFVQAPDNSQSLNRYSYVLNNPLSYTDPSGFFWDDIVDAFEDAWDWAKDNWKTIAVIGITIITAGWGAGLAGGLVGLMGIQGTLLGSIVSGAISGAITGFVGGFSGALLYGASLSDALNAGFRSAKIGALKGGLLGSVDFALPSWANTVGESQSVRLGIQIGRTITNAAINGMVAELSGGKFSHGFLLSVGADMVRWGVESYVLDRAEKQFEETGVRMKNYKGLTYRRGVGGPDDKRVIVDGKTMSVAVKDADHLNIGIFAKNIENPIGVEEGSIFSQAFNMFGGMNSMSVFHDMIAVHLEFLGTGTLYSFFNVSTIFTLGVPLTYAGLGLGNTLYEQGLLSF